MLDELKRSVMMAKGRVRDKYLRKWLPHEPDFFLAKHGDRLIAAVELAEATLSWVDSKVLVGPEWTRINQRSIDALAAYRKATEESHESR